MRFRYVVTFVLALALPGCSAHHKNNPAVTSQAVALKPIFTGWQCPMTAAQPVAGTPPCSWTWGGVRFEVCADRINPDQMTALGCAPVPRHAVWYIMVPPLDGMRHMNPEAPYLDWDAFARYRTAPECQSALASLKASVNPSQPRVEMNQTVDESRQGYTASIAPYAQCASSDLARPRHRANPAQTRNQPPP